MKYYDIFISYRRSSYETANLIATRLKAAGYSVFFDMETLRSGKFNEQLFDVIDNCKDFILVLPPEALDRCVNEDDWIRLEVCRAMDGKKNIVPVMLNGFTWPDPMPRGMESLSDYQALTATSTEYFDMAMERLQKRYILSRRRIPLFKLLKYASALVLVLLAIVAILWGVFGILSRDVCHKYATLLAKDAGCVYSIVDENYSLAKDWEEFDNIVSFESDKIRIAEMQQNMLDRIDLVQENLQFVWIADSVELEISPYHNFLLSLHKINAEEIAVSPVMATFYYTDYLQQLDIIRNAVVEPTAMNRSYVTMLFEVFEHSANSYYASVLSELSLFPSKSLATFNSLSPDWIHFPVHLYKIGEDYEYYENIVNTENRLAEEAMSRHKSILERQSAAIDDLDRRSEEFARQMEDDFADIQGQLDQTAEMMQQAAELQELELQFAELYETMKGNCTFEAEDDQWNKWGKIVHWGSFLSMLADSCKEQDAMGVPGLSSVTPEKAYADMNILLELFQAYHPDSKDYVASAKHFYKEVSAGVRPYAGIIIFAFQNDQPHPLFKKGDIVIAYNGKPIINYDDLKSAYQADKNATITFIRLQDDCFVEYQKPISDVDIVGFVGLTE